MPQIPIVSREKASRLFSELKQAHRARRRPIPVSFRELASEVGLGERITHFLHPYPAKLLRSIPAFFLSVNQMAPEGTIVFDPFCGSGTVLVEAMCAGFDSVGIDVNPLATLISRVKTRRLDPARLAVKQQGLLRHRSDTRPSHAPSVVNMDYWFYPHVIKQLAQIEAALKSVPDGPYRDFFQVCFSVCVRKVSLANPRVSVPVRMRPDVYPEEHALRKMLDTRLNWLKRVDVWKVFSEIIDENRSRVGHLASVPKTSSCEVLTGDVRAWQEQRRRFVPPCSLVITSPPYLGAQKYVRAASLSLNWLRLTDPTSLRRLERDTIGREHLNKGEYIELERVPPSVARVLRLVARTNPLRAQIANHYISDLRAFFDQISMWLAPKGHCILVIGPNTVCGMPFHTPAVALELARECGLSLVLELVDDIKSHGLMTRRNRNAAVINREHVLVFRRMSHG